MNLSQIATLVGQRLGIPTSDGTLKDGAACRAFIILRHDQLYRAFAWKDSLVEFETPITPSTAYVPSPTAYYMPTKGHVILPSIIQHVMGVRFGRRALRVEKPQLYYRVGHWHRDWTKEFYLLSSCVWEFDTMVEIELNNDNGADNNVSVQTDLLQPDGVSIQRVTTLLESISRIVSNTDRVDNLIKPQTQGGVTLSANGTQIIALNTNDLSAPKCQRIKLEGTPSSTVQGSENLHVLGKRNTPTFAADTDSPGVNGLDGVLFALAYYDMANRDERGGSPDAAMALNEAVGPNFLTTGKPGGFLAKLIEEEVLQEAYNARIVPEHGFGGGHLYGEYGCKSDPYCGDW